MDWIEMNSETVLEDAVKGSFKNKGVAIFKHSTRCSISRVAQSRLSSKWDFKDDLPIYHLDLIYMLFHKIFHALDHDQL